MAKSESAFDRQLAALGQGRHGRKKEIRHLAGLLVPGEALLGLCSGVSGRDRWYLAVSTRRVLLVGKGLFGGIRLVEVPLVQIRCFSRRDGLVFGELSLDLGGQSKTLRQIKKAELAAVGAALSQALARTPVHTPGDTPTQTPAPARNAGAGSVKPNPVQKPVPRKEGTPVSTSTPAAAPGQDSAAPSASMNAGDAPLVPDDATRKKQPAGKGNPPESLAP